MQPSIHLIDADSEYFIDEGCYIIELSNSENDEGVSIARARVTPGVTTRWHKLASTTERYVILSGTGKVEIGDLPPQTVTAGDTVIIPPDCPQRISNIGDEDLLFLAICSPRFQPQAYEDVESTKA